MEALITAVGGLGLFLFGMAVMTSGLKKIAGDKMHQWLSMATKTPVSGAFLLLPIYLGAWNGLSPSTVTTSPEVVAVAFHSTFNIIGVIAVLPFTNQFASLIERMIPIREPVLTAALDPTLLGDPAACAQALEASLRKLAGTALRHTAFLLNPDRFEKPAVSLQEIAYGIEETRSFAVKNGEITDERDLDTSRLFDSLHAIDHLDRLTNRLLRGEALFATLNIDHGLKEGASLISEQLDSAAIDISDGNRILAVDELRKIAEDFEADKPKIRSELIASASRGHLTSDDLDNRLDAARLLRRIAYHSWRIAFYVNDFNSRSSHR